MESIELRYKDEYIYKSEFYFQVFQDIYKTLQNTNSIYIDLTFNFSHATFNFNFNFSEFIQDFEQYYIQNVNIFKGQAYALVQSFQGKAKQSSYTYQVQFIFDKTIFQERANFTNICCHNLSFKETVFYESVDFTNISCHSLIFEDTIFHKDTKFAFVDVEEFIYKPYQLDVDVTFYHREKANMAEGKLRGDSKKGRIGTFTFRHHFAGSGKTYFVGIKFEKAAFFQDVNLENVVFSYIDQESMSKCYFANSFIENTQFNKCEFDYRPNLPFPLSLIGVQGIFALLTISILIFSYLCIEIPFSLICFVSIFTIANLFFMALLFLLQKIPVLKTLNRHIYISDEKSLIEKSVKSKNYKKQHENFQSLREVYRQLRINHEKHGDWQLAGEFYYSQRYCELVVNQNNDQLWQYIILNAHHVVNGFGERWLRALVWVFVTLSIFAQFGGEPNRDYVSTKSTPEYLLVAHKPMSKKENASDYNRTYYQDFNEANVTDSNVSGQAHFMLYSKTTYLYSKDKENEPKDIFAYDNRFDYGYSKQYIPMLSNTFEVKLLHSLSKLISPFTSSEKQWFQDRSGKAYFSGFLETMLLWLFFGGFILAVKNKIKR